jgi:hypothetical protein
MSARRQSEHRNVPTLPRWLVRFYEMATESRRGRRNRFLRRLARHDR